MKQILNYINGQLQPSVSNQVLDVINPAIGVAYTQAPDSDKDDIDMAVTAATKAYPSWAKTSPEKRSEILLKIAALIDSRFDELAISESIDNGKPITLSKTMDIPRAASNMRFFANAITQFSSEAHDMIAEEAINYTLRQPIGVVACISPWNLPLYLLTWKIAPALAAGNTVIAKPSEVTPMTAYLLSEICIEAGLPPGVLNIVHGRGEVIGDTISRHPLIKAISFTGSTRVGSHIASIAAPLFKKLSLEMGGKNPTIIFSDCNYEKALSSVVRSSFTNQGQICLCGSRIYIQNSIYEKFKMDFVNEVSKLKVGHPMDKDVNVGAIVSKAHYDKILFHINLAKEEGGNILIGGHEVIIDGYENGYFIAPTIIEGLKPECRTNQEEIFGPVVTIAPFEDDVEALQMANHSAYGLACSMWSENVSRCHRMARDINVGIVWINTWLMRDLRTPFGGMNASGVGREGGNEALRFFTEAKNVCVKY